jgi:hypothetical protein
MDVRFTRTGYRQYGIAVRLDGEWAPARQAPGYDEHLPHDLVHFLVEAELGLLLGIFGRQAAGGGRFPGTDPAGARRQARREQRLKAVGHSDMARSETVTGACTVLWKLRHGLIRECPEWLRGTVPPGYERHADAAWAAQVERVLARLDEAAARWHDLEIGESMVLSWPHQPVSLTGAATAPRPRTRRPAPRRRARSG